jgi:hypothetical protein
VVHMDAWRAEYRARDAGETKVESKDRNFSRGFGALAKAELVCAWQDYVWLTN